MKFKCFILALIAISLIGCNQKTESIKIQKENVPVPVIPAPPKEYVNAKSRPVSAFKKIPTELKKEQKDTLEGTYNLLKILAIDFDQLVDYAEELEIIINTYNKLSTSSAADIQAILNDPDVKPEDKTKLQEFMSKLDKLFKNEKD